MIWNRSSACLRLPTRLWPPRYSTCTKLLFTCCSQEWDSVSTHVFCAPHHKLWPPCYSTFIFRIVEIELVVLNFPCLSGGGTPHLFVFLDDPHHKAMTPVILNNIIQTIVFIWIFTNNDTPFEALITFHPPCFFSPPTTVMQGWSLGISVKLSDLP